MGDIAFILLIFFVILARAADDSHLQWEPAEINDVEATGGSVASVVIDAEKKLYLNGQSISIDSLPESLENQLGNLAAGNRQVLLKVDRETPADVFEQVIEAISIAGGDLIHVLNQEENE